jgi:type II secretory pathway pseudopilin PulG
VTHRANERNPNDEHNVINIRSVALTSPSTFDIGLPRRSRAKADASSFRAGGAFTIIELLVVIGIIIVLAALILSTVSYVKKKGLRARTETEIAAMSAAIESYKADNGIYPRGQSTSVPASGVPVYTVATTGTDDLNARPPDFNPTQKIYQDASRYLYEQLSGDVNLDLAADTGSKTYFAFKESMLAVIKDANGNSIGLSQIKDPFGNSYGYSTAYQHDIDQGINSPTHGYNPTFDLWSTAGTTSGSATDLNQWIKNW